MDPWRAIPLLQQGWADHLAYPGTCQPKIETYNITVIMRSSFQFSIPSPAAGWKGALETFVSANATVLVEHVA